MGRAGGHAVWALASAAALILSACGGDDTSSSATSASTSAGNATTTGAATATSGGATATASSVGATDDSASTSLSEDLAAEADALYAGTYQEPPSESPPPAIDKSVWVISCGEAAIGCSALAGGAAEGAEALGWDVTLFDGKLGVDGAYGAGVRQAVAADADAIIVGAIDCAAISQPLAEAKAAGVLAVGVGSYDCDDPRSGGGEPLFDGVAFQNEARPTTSEESMYNGALRAVWLLNEAGAEDLEVLVFEHTDSLLGTDFAAGFSEQITQSCPSCEVVPVEFTFADLATGTIGTKATDALTQHPDADALFVPYDSLLLLGVAQSVVRSNRSDDLAVVGAEGYAPNLELIRTNGGQDFSIGASARWTGWGAADTLNRLFAGEEPVGSGSGYQFIDAEHMGEDDGEAFVPPIDYQAAFRAAWGVK